MFDWVWDRDSCNQFAGVWILGIFQDFIPVTLFDETPILHHRDSVREDVHDGEVMANEKTCELQLILKF